MMKTKSMKFSKIGIRVSLLLLFIVSLLMPMYSQNSGINSNYYDSLHQILRESKLTHYRIYYKDLLIYNWKDPECNNDTSNTASLMKSITSLAVGELLENGFIDSLDEPV